MKKTFYLFLFIATLAFVSVKAGLNKNRQAADLLLKNIECLATPENGYVKCLGIGSVDCPVIQVKVYYYFQ